ncbi:MAG: zinc ribbon domain-containing protein [Phycisphaerae bacterium]|jgi:hypothetical protein
MAGYAPNVCPRCGRQNPSRARYCGQCGLNLAAAGGDDLTRMLSRNNRRSGTGVVVFLVMMSVALSTIAVLYRDRTGRNDRMQHRHQWVPRPPDATDWQWERETPRPQTRWHRVSEDHETSR